MCIINRLENIVVLISDVVISNGDLVLYVDIEGNFGISFDIIDLGVGKSKKVINRKYVDMMVIIIVRNCLKKWVLLC